MPSDHLITDEPPELAELGSVHSSLSNTLRFSGRNLAFLRALRGHSIQEIARSVGLKPEGVNSAIRRARLQLKT